MISPIHIDFVGEDPAGHAPSRGSAALEESEDPQRILRLVIRSEDPGGLEALRYARRSLLREELTLGLETGEPSLETAVFSSSEIVWTVPAAERQRCLEKLAELEARANRTLRELLRARA